jgi:putative heme transporter
MDDSPRPRTVLLRAAGLVVLLAVVIGGIELLVPGAARRLDAADPLWLAAAVALEAVALVGYVALFHAVFARPPHRLTLRRSGEIALGELAGFALVPTGAGGPVVRFWGLRGSGMPWSAIGARSVAYAVLFNLPYLAAALVLGLGAAVGVLPGEASTAATLAPLGVVAVTGLVILGVLLARRARWLDGPKRWQRIAREVLAIVPGGLRQVPWFARHPLGPAGAVAYWAGDCAVLWAAFQACGGAPAIGVIALAYMLGQLGNLLPLPGGVGGVEPLMLGIFVASGVDAGLAGAAIVCYRAIALGMQSLAGVASVASLIPAVRRERAARELRPLQAAASPPA